MQSPTGSVVALSSAASTVFSLGMAFLGFWGIHESGNWGTRDYVIAVLAMAGFLCLGSVPWLATAPAGDDDGSKIQVARRAFLCGVAAVWCAVLVSLI